MDCGIKPVIFIFSAATGAGHNLAAASLKESLEEKGYDVRIHDAFKETNAALNHFVTMGYKQLVEVMPLVYKHLYRQFNKMTPIQQKIFGITAKIINPELVPLIEKENPKLIISTHPFITYMLGVLKDLHKINQPILSFVTDYKIHGVYLHPAVNAYVVGSEYTKQTMIDKGVSPDIVFPYGIPVRSAFNEKGNQCEKDHNKGTILMMAGSMGTYHMERAFVAIMKANEPLNVIVVCGNNPRIVRDIQFLAKIYSSPQKNVEVFGFVDNIPELMDQSDAIVTKPGGLTTTEAMVKAIPMIIPYYYPGQEEENTDFLVEMGMAVKVDKIKDLTHTVDYLIENKHMIDEMSFNMTEESKQHSKKKTVELCEELIEKSKQQNEQGQ